MSYRKHHVKSKIHKIKPKKSVFKNWFFWLAVLAIIVAGVTAYFVLFFDGIQIKEIKIAGNEKIGTDDIEKTADQEFTRVFLSLGPLEIKSRSILLVDASEASIQMLKKFPGMASVSIKKYFPHTLAVSITERKPVGFFCQDNSKCFLIDETGVVFEPSQYVTGANPIIRQVDDTKNIGVGDTAVNKGIMDAISKIGKVLGNNFQINIEEALVTTPSVLDIKTSEAWHAYFDLNSDMENQVLKINALLKNELTEKARKGLQYIDLRFQDKAYYK